MVDILKALGGFIRDVGFPAAVATLMMMAFWKMHQDNKIVLAAIATQLNVLTEVLAVIFKIDLQKIKSREE